MAESCFSPALAAAGIFTAQPVTLPPRRFGNVAYHNDMCLRSDRN
jgi:hypothetical protein